MEWLRVLYAYPDEADDRLLEVMAAHLISANTLICPSSTSMMTFCVGCTAGAPRQDVRRILDKSRAMGLTLRTSLIVGFPGETEAQFQELLDFVKEERFDRMGAFAYSPEEDTPAASMPDQIPGGGQAGSS